MRYPNIAKMRFTLSVSPALSRFNLSVLLHDEMVERLRRIGPRIHDINFTCHIAPFMIDAHGVTVGDSENTLHLRQMVQLQEQTGIRVTPVFNNIYVPNTRRNLELFVEGFKPLYEMGIRSVSIPHILWLKIGLLQRTFPDVGIKNTVLRKVHSGQEFWNCAEAGYEYVNLDQSIARDLRVLKEVAQAQTRFHELTGRHVVTSIITGEGCFGACALRDEHYLHTMGHHQTGDAGSNIEIFRYPQSFSCLATTEPDLLSPMHLGLPPFRDDLEETCAYFDVIKLAGRRAFQSLADCIASVETLVDGDGPFAFDPPDLIQYAFSHAEQHGGALARWRQMVRECRYQCWDCTACSDLVAAYMLRGGERIQAG